MSKKILNYSNPEPKNLEKVKLETPPLENVNNDTEKAKVNFLLSSTPKATFKKVLSLKEIKQNKKLEAQKKLFLNSMCRELNDYNVDCELNTELLLHVVNKSESFFLGSSSDRKLMKDECIKTLMLPYFYNDINILNMGIKAITHKIKKSNVLRRMYRRLSNFFYQK